MIFDGWLGFVFFVYFEVKFVGWVFDVGIGIGIWVIDFGDEYLDVYVIGVDFLLI